MNTIQFFGNPYLMMSNTKMHQPFNDSFAIMILCNDQQEIDTYWNCFTHERKSSMCGWCTDKFGLRWQIIPKNMGELMSKPNAGQIMYKQTKIINEEYLT
jgi:predicted 3-demethylubiquinone-9 3-methyltransferase (glyoxalase superfamily)